MNLAGEVVISDTRYYFYMKDLKNSNSYSLISEVNLDELLAVRMGAVAQYPVISTIGLIPKFFNEQYLIEEITKSKVTGIVKKFGSANIIEIILRALEFARAYRFDAESIGTDTIVSSIASEVRHVFSAKDSTLAYKYITVNDLFESLYLEYNDIKIDLFEVKFNLPKAKVELKEVKKNDKKEILIATLKTITYDMLCDSLDMSWYKMGDKCFKDYSAIESNEQFELEVMTPLIKEILEYHARGEVLDIAVDTETTGLNVYDLSPDNPSKDHCVAIPISWKDNQAAVIFTDMEYFSNAENNYVACRLAELFEKFNDVREIKYLENGEWKTSRIARDWYSLDGHNFPFDGRVFFDLKQKFYFDEDSLQMAFVISPRTVRGNNKLKHLTRLIFKHETPELTDILGRGNEDKYRYLKNKEVAIIYGCADADYTRQLVRYLRRIMEPKLYRMYKKQDIPIMNILYQSEYWGMSVYEKEVKELGKQTFENINILKKTMYSYVGGYIDYYNKASVFEAQLNSGIITKEEYDRQLHSIEIDNSAVYEFEFKATQLREVIYGIMKYPIKAYTAGKKKLPKLDKFVIDKLLKEGLKEGETPPRKLKEDVLVYGADRTEYERLLSGSKADKKKADSMVLISAKEFNSKKYPLALILKKYADLNKEYTSYYKPIEQENLEGKIFKSYSLARIETRRIMNPGQTIKANLKALVRSYDDDYYVVDFDMSQVEYRIMVSLSHFVEMIEKMKDPENDYHTETAANSHGIKPYKVTKKQRKGSKSISFGVPYGLGEISLCEKIFGVVNEETLFETRMMLLTWKKNNAPIMRLLEEARAQALEVWEPSDEVRQLIGLWKKDEDGNFVTDENGNKIPLPVGRVCNKLGFYRIFNLDGIGQTPADKKRRASGKFTAAESVIRRAAGNYRIQSYAAELFRLILTRFYNRCEKEGIGDKVKWHMLIHDELLCSVHKSINPILMYKIIMEECMLTMKGHTNYFVGINIGDTWAETKDDSREAPVYFVQRMIKRYEAGEFDGVTWFDHPWEFIKGYREEYVKERIGEVVEEIQTDFKTNPINFSEIIEKMDNYTVRAYVNDYPLYEQVDYQVNDKDKADVEYYDNLVWCSHFKTWVLEYFGDGKVIIDLDGKIKRLNKSKSEELKPESTMLIDSEDLFEDTFDWDEEEETAYYDFDNIDSEDAYGIYRNDLVIDIDNDEDVGFKIDETKKDAKTIADMIITSKKYKYVKNLNNQIIITVNSDDILEAIKRHLIQFKTADGSRVLFKQNGHLEPWFQINGSISVDEIESYIGTLEQSKERFSNLLVDGNRIILTLSNPSSLARVREYLSYYRGDELTIIVKNSFGNTIFRANSSKKIDLSELDRIGGKHDKCERAKFF